jgi:hypothetical protein
MFEKCSYQVACLNIEFSSSLKKKSWTYNSWNCNSMEVILPKNIRPTPLPKQNVSAISHLESDKRLRSLNAAFPCWSCLPYLSRLSREYCVFIENCYSLYTERTNLWSKKGHAMRNYPWYFTWVRVWALYEKALSRWCIYQWAIHTLLSLYL